MSLLLAVLSSVLLGGADFAGGIAAKRMSALTVVVWANVAGLLVALTAAATVVPGAPRVSDLGWGVLAGLASCLGAALLYRALGSGLMTLAAPIAAVAAALLPLGAGLLAGNQLRPLAAVGVLLAVAALALVSRTGPHSSSRATATVRISVGFAIGAGLAFGAFMVSLSHTPHSSGLWPLVIARLSSLTVLVVAARVRRVPLGVDVSSLRICWLVGVLDMASAVLYLIAVRDGSLALVGLLASMAPVSTVLLARIVLRERTWIWQRLGAGLAVGSVLLLALA